VGALPAPGWMKPVGRVLLPGRMAQAATPCARARLTWLRCRAGIEKRAAPSCCWPPAGPMAPTHRLPDAARRGTQPQESHPPRGSLRLLGRYAPDGANGHTMARPMAPSVLLFVAGAAR
jgi:hypothetical protein